MGPERPEGAHRRDPSTALALRASLGMTVGRAAMIFFVLLGLASGPAEAQMWRGTGRASGVVRSPDGEPIRGATVTLRWARDPEAGPPPAKTSKKGGWSFLGLAPGPWLLLIEADGYRQSQGTVEVRPGASPPVEVTLRTLVIQTPTISEGRVESLRTWIETGNTLLEQQQWSAARAEYEKALAELRGPARAEVLRPVARTHYMEGDVDTAVERLQEAILADPGNETSESLYRTLMEIEERSEEAETFLAGVADGSIRAESSEPAPAEAAAPGRRYDKPELVPAEAGREGSYATSFTEHHPLAGIATFSERFDQSLDQVAKSDPAEGVYDLGDEAFRVFVPKSYEPDGAWGLFVWVSPTQSGHVPTPGAQAALRDNKLIWVGADRSGNSRLPWNRVGLALDAAHNVARLYEIDPERVYVGGYSGGGRVASALTMLYPEVFRGGLFVYGVDFYKRIAVPDRPGSDWLPWFPPPARSTLAGLKADSRLVLLTGERDFNRLQTEVVAERYRDEGFEHVTYIEIPGAGHYDWPSGRWLSQALAALDP